MKTIGICIISYLLLIVSCPAHGQNYNNTFYFGMGTGLSSYLGGYFGNAYSMKVLSDYSDDYYFNDYNYSYDYNTVWSPVQFDLTGGVNVSENFALEFSSTFIFAFDGYIDPEFVSGSTGERDYLDRNSRSQLYAVPVSAALKFYSVDQYGSGFFLKAGPAFQYTSEEYDRVREYYSYEYYYPASYFTYLYTVSKSEWLPGFTTSLGLQFQISDNTISYTELAYSYFNIDPNNQTALALDRAPEAQLFAFNAKIFFNF
ncbi:MAG TPA: hypothetical protein PKC58_16630 [Ignavibacteria bacterium]|nr:hypothetical protein [Ignavibacteria bacterium]